MATSKNSVYDLGLALGREARRVGFSVIRIAKVTGATRQTVYNWLNGTRRVAPYYRPRVTELVTLLRTSEEVNEAWRRARKKWNVS